jgi:hypothetical protein
MARRKAAWLSRHSMRMSRSQVSAQLGLVGLLAPHDLVERRAGEEDAAVFEQAGDVAVEERQQERGDVVAVAVGSTLRPTSATCSTGSARIRRGRSRNCCPIAGRR